MQLHLLLPGLLWPGKALHDTAYDLELPTLSRLLGQGSLSWQPPLSLEAWLARAFGINAAEAPAAALRLQGEGGSPGNDCWLCADPAHLAFEQGRLTLAGGELEVSDAEMAQIVTALTPHLAAHLPGFEALRAGPYGHAYLKLARPPQLLSTPPSAAIGRSLQWSSPRGPDAPTWQRLGNELQMLLHTLPANRERERQGRPSINTLWFWGAGVLPQARPGRYDAIVTTRHDGAASLPAVLRGLAAWAGSSLRQPKPGAARWPSTGNTLLVCDDLLLPAQQFDAGAWRALLSGIDSDHLAPLASALSRGNIDRLRLTALGEEASLDVELKPRDLWRFWRKPRALHQLRYPTEMPR